MTALTAAAEPAPAPSPFTSKLSSPQQLMSPSYAQSGKILFAAAVLVCALLPAALCARAYRRRRAADDAAERATDFPGILASLPVISYAPTMEEAECAVCLSALEKGEQARTLPGCDHLFHLACINAWLLSHSTCPLCRSPAAAAARSQPTAVAAPSLPPAVCERRGDSVAATSAGARVKLPSTSRVLLVAGMLFSIELGLAREAEVGGNQTGQVDLERGEAAGTVVDVIPEPRR